MRLLDLTLPTAVENVALDEALLEQREAEGGRPVLRLWEADQPMVVIGRSSRRTTEVNLAACAADQVPVIRRVSGGASIVAGPGCLMYALILDYETQPELRMLDQAHAYVMGRIASAVARLGIDSRLKGTCDLTVGNRKFSGNAMRARRKWLLYHGTLLCDMRLDLITRYLDTPERQPDYRAGRGHDEFLTTLGVTGPEMKRALIDEWQPQGEEPDWPRERTATLVANKYVLAEWNEAR